MIIQSTLNYQKHGNQSTSSTDPFILKCMRNLLNSTAKDVELACSEGKCVKVHRIILISYSPYFRSRLDACKEPEITILFPRVPVSVMEALLEFMYTGNVRVRKDLVDHLVAANKRFCITGLDSLLSDHEGSSLPPKKKQRTEAVPSDNSSSLFRPWDSTAIPTRTALMNHPLYGIPPMPFPMIPNFMPFSMSLPGPIPPMPLFPGNLFSKTMHLPISTDNNSNTFSEALPFLQSPRMSWSLPYGNELSGSTSPSETPGPNILSQTAPPIPSSSFSISENISHITASDPTAQRKFEKIKSSESKSELIVKDTQVSRPNKKSRCDICNKSVYKIASHKILAHKQFKKPIDCCGTKFTTRLDLKNHKKFYHKQMTTGDP